MQPQIANVRRIGAAPDWRKFILNDDVLPEPDSEADRIAVWLPGNHEEGFRNWERVSNLTRTEFAVEPGVWAAAATLVQARQPIRGLVGKLFGRFRKMA